MRDVDLSQLLFLVGLAAWLALLGALGHRGAWRPAIVVALVPLALTVWAGLDAYVFDPYDIAQTWVPIVGTVAFVLTWIGAGCYGLGRLLRRRTL